MNNSLRPAIATALQQAVSAGAVRMHRAVRPHLIHCHVAGGVGHAWRWLHAARQAGQSGLGGKYRDQGNSDELKNLLHALEDQYTPASVRHSDPSHAGAAENLVCAARGSGGLADIFDPLVPFYPLPPRAL